MSDGFPAHYFDQIADMERGNFWFENRNQLLVWAMERFFPSATDFLEIGCGNGFVLQGIAEALPRLTVSGADLFVAPLALARQRVPKAKVLQMDAMEIPFRREFDVIGAFDVLEHIEDDSEVIQQMATALRPGGGLLISVPQHPFLWSAVDEFAEHRRRYTRPELIDKLRRAGFRLLHTTSFVTLLFPVMVVSRLCRKGDVPEGAMDRELSLGPALNAAFSLVMSLERGLLRTGMSLPFGGSLLAVARLGKRP